VGGIWTVYETNSELFSSVASSLDVEQYLPPLDVLFLLLLRGEFGLFEMEVLGTGLVKPMLLLPPPLHPDETVMVTGDEHGEPALFTIFIVVEVFFLFLVSLSRVEDSNAGKRKMNLVSLESKRNIK
jgi:hypothetical protein